MRRCTRCIVPEQYPGVYFNEEGLCNFCLTQKTPPHPLGQERLLRHLASFNNKGIYDCIVPISGGKDSMYILYYVVRELGLKPVAVNYDSGFMSEIARSNMQNGCHRLNVPLIIKRPDQRRQEEMLKMALKVSDVVGEFFHICANCETLLRVVAINAAREHNVPVVIWGSSRNQNTTAHDLHHFGTKAFIKRSPIIKIIKLMPLFFTYAVFNFRQRREFHVPLKYAWNPLVTIPFTKKNPAFVIFDQYIHTTSRQIKILQDELGWEHPPHTTMRFDCLLHCFGNFQSLNSTGISSDGIIYCYYLRNNLISRHEALDKEKDVIDRVSSECKDLLEGLGVEKLKILNKKTFLK